MTNKINQIGNDELFGLVRNGYQFVPVANIDNKSIPLIKGFLDSETQYGEDDINQWLNEGKYSLSNLALVGGKNKVCALDFDIDYPTLANKLHRAIINKYPSMPVRMCNNPRFAIVFRATDELMEYSNGYSNVYNISGSATRVSQQIEFVGNKLLTIFGRHRTSDKPYTWHKNVSPLNTKVSELPLLCIKDVKNIFKAMHNNVPSHYIKLVDESYSYRHTKADEVATMSNVRQEKRYSDSEITNLLKGASGVTRSEYIEMGMAIHHHYDGSHEGLLRWDEWASQFTSPVAGKGYQGLDDCRRDWQSFRATGGITMQTIDYQRDPVARKEEYIQTKKLKSDNSLQQFLKTKVLIEKDGLIGDLTHQPGEATLGVGNFHVTSSNIQMPVEIEDAKGSVKIKNMKVSHMWLEHENRKTVYSQQYVPVRDRILKGYVQDTDKEYWNVYQPAKVNITSKTDKLPYFLDHVNYLFNNEGDAHWYLSWLGSILQNPVERFRTAPLHISTFHGTGRGTLVDIMIKLLGRSNCTTTRIKTLVDDSAKTGYLDNKLLCAIHETYTRGAVRWQVNDSLRTILGDNYQDVDVKYGKQGAQDIYTRFFMSSNHIDGLGIDDTDKRIEVFLNRQLPKNKQYYIKLKEMVKDNDFIDQVYSYLMSYKYDVKSLMESRRTESKKIVMRATQSPLANAFFEFRAIAMSQVFTQALLNNFISDYLTYMYPEENTMSLQSKMRSEELVFLQKDYVQCTKIRRIKNTSTKIKSFSAIDLDSYTEDTIIKELLSVKARLSNHWDDKKKNYEEYNKTIGE